MKITVCVGSSCHLKGSGEVVATLNRLAGEAGVLEPMANGKSRRICPCSVCRRRIPIRFA